MAMTDGHHGVRCVGAACGLLILQRVSQCYSCFFPVGFGAESLPPPAPLLRSSPKLLHPTCTPLFSATIRQAVLWDCIADHTSTAVLEGWRS